MTTPTPEALREAAALAKKHADEISVIRGKIVRIEMTLDQCTALIADVRTKKAQGEAVTEKPPLLKITSWQDRLTGFVGDDDVQSAMQEEIDALRDERAALYAMVERSASHPTQRKAVELPPLPTPDAYIAMGAEGSFIIPPRDFGKYSAYPVFTAQQYRQGQRDALAAAGVEVKP